MLELLSIKVFWKIFDDDSRWELMFSQILLKFASPLFKELLIKRVLFIIIVISSIYLILKVSDKIISRAILLSSFRGVVDPVCIIERSILAITSGVVEISFRVSE